MEKKNRHVETVKWQRDDGEPLKAFYVCQAFVQGSMKSGAVSDRTPEIGVLGSVQNPSHKLKKKISLRPHCSSLTLLLQLCYDTLDVVDPETRCMRLVCNLRRDSDPAKAATSASLQRGPDSSDCHWQQLSARRFAENTLQARVRNCSIYQKLKIGAHGEWATSMFFRRKKKTTGVWSHRNDKSVLLYNLIAGALYWCHYF